MRIRNARARGLEAFTLIGLGALACDNSDLVAHRSVDTDGTGGTGGATAAGGAGTSGSANGATGGRDASGGADGGISDADAGGSPDSTDAGHGGAGGSEDTDGGAPEDGGVPSPPCDDGNPCTADSFTGGACRNEPVPDGQRCEDGNLCTLGDRCSSGVCKPGATQTGTVRELGRLQAYGSSGSVATAGDGRFLFSDEVNATTRLTQAVVVDGALEAQGTVDLPVSFYVSAFSAPPIMAEWDNLAAVADSDSSVQINGEQRQVFLVSVSPEGELTARGSVSVSASPDISEVVSSMVGRAKRLLVCTNFGFFSPPVGTLHWLDVTDPDAPVQIAKGSLGVQCGALAMSESGFRVYVNTSNGVRFTDLDAWSGTGDLTFATDPIVPTDSGLSVRGNTLLARSGTTLHVLDETTHEEKATFTVPGALSAALTASGIFVEGDRPSGGGSEYFVALYSPSGALLHERTLTRFDYPNQLPNAKVAVGERYAADSLDHQVFDVTSAGFAPVAEPGVGSLSHLYAGGDAVHARGYFSTQRIDVTTPATPKILAGGPDGNPAFGIKLDESLGAGSLVPESDQDYLFLSDYSYGLVPVSTTRGHASSTRIERVTVDADEHYVSQGFVTLPGGNAQLLSAGDYVYRIEPLLVAGVRLQRWLQADLRAGIETPALDLVLGDQNKAARVAFDVDPVARMAVVTDGTNIDWVDLSGPGPTVTTTVPAAVPGPKLKVRGHRVAYCTGVGQGDLAFAERDSSDEEIVPAVGDTIQDVLAYDGTVAYLSVRRNVAVVKRGTPVDQALVAKIPMRNVPQSIVAMDGALVAGAESELLTFAPECE